MELEREHIGHHLVQQYNEDLENLHRGVLEMGKLVQWQLADAVSALERHDTELAARVVGRDVEVNTREVQLDKECARILVRRQPAAGDLRLIFAVIKTVTDLERMGDQAEHVARAVLEMGSTGAGPAQPSMTHLASRVLGMIAKALDAFARLDVRAALEVIQEDLSADREYQASMRQLLTYMMEDPRIISSALQLAWTARAFERIGDHAKNIAEYVVFMVQGEDVRHISRAEREKRLGTTTESPTG
jgi:phosphate transport system protein